MVDSKKDGMSTISSRLSYLRAILHNKMTVRLYILYIRQGVFFLRKNDCLKLLERKFNKIYVILKVLSKSVSQSHRATPDRTKYAHKEENLTYYKYKANWTLTKWL